MNVVLITPSSENISAFGARAISSYLKTRGHTTTVITLPIIPDVYRDHTGCLYTRPYEYSEPITNQIVELSAGAGLVGISFMTQYLHCAAKLTEVLRQRTATPVVWGGVHPTVDPEGSLEHTDIVCVGEGEYAMAELADRLAAGDDYGDVANLCFKRDGQVVANAVRPLVEELDTLPPLDYGPAGHYVRDMDTDKLVPFDAERFERHLAVVPYVRNKHLKSFMYFTTRGCPYRCSYCVNDFYRSLYGSKGFVRKHSVERVVSELEGIISQYPCIEEIEFCDDNFALRPVPEIEEFARLYKARIGLPFQLLMSPQSITEEKIGPLVDAGLVFVETGIQSAADCSEELYQRQVEEDDLMRAADILHDHLDRMAPPCYHLILDNPFESREDTLKTFALSLRLPRPFWFKRSSLVAFPGTRVHQRFVEQGLVTDDESDISLKILEMPSTRYLNFLFLLNNQNYPRLLLRLLARPGPVACFDRPFWTPFFGVLEKGIRAGSRALKGLRVLLRGDWATLKRAIDRRRNSRNVESSRPPAF